MAPRASHRSWLRLPGSTVALSDGAVACGTSVNVNSCVGLLSDNGSLVGACESSDWAAVVDVVADGKPIEVLADFGLVILVPVANPGGAINVEGWPSELLICKLVAGSVCGFSASVTPSGKTLAACVSLLDGLAGFGVDAARTGCLMNFSSAESRQSFQPLNAEPQATARAIAVDLARRRDPIANQSLALNVRQAFQLGLTDTGPYHR